MSRRLAAWLLIAAAGCARSGAADHRGHAALAHPEEPAAEASPTTVPTGYAHVALPRGTAERLDLATTVAQIRRLKRTVRAYGAVVPDETRTSHVHAKVRGWIETLAVNYTGQEVAAGDSLCAIYSPEVYSAQLELLSMLATPAATGPGEFVQADRQVRSQVIAAARRRLRLWDVPEEEILRLTRTRDPRRTFTLRAPRPGTIVARQAVAGLYVDAATELYTVSDLSRVWVQVDVYGPDLPHVHVGDRVRVVLEGQAPVELPIAFLAPSLDPATRTVQARLELANPQRSFRPGAFVLAELDVDLGEGVAVPDEAVVRTGKRNLVFVVLPAPREIAGAGDLANVEPREVTLGESGGGWTRIVAGVQPGEHVASRGTFLLDSESRIRASRGGAGHAH